jgi:hypothetical protein
MTLCHPDLVVDVSWTWRFLSLLWSIGGFPCSKGPTRLLSKDVQAARKAASVDGALIGRTPFPPCTLSSLQVEARLNTSDPHHSHILSLRLPFPHIFFSCSHTPYSSPPSISQLPCGDGVYSLAGQKSASLCHWLKATPVHSPSSLGSHSPRPLSCNMIPRAFGALVPCMPFIVNLTVR